MVRIERMGRIRQIIVSESSNANLNDLVNPTSPDELFVVVVCDRRLERGAASVARR
jgi:hypothetical protein